MSFRFRFAGTAILFPFVFWPEISIQSYHQPILLLINKSLYLSLLTCVLLFGVWSIYFTDKMY
jgi:hypothetical protein